MGLLYVNDVHKLYLRGFLSLYAYDSGLFYSSDSVAGSIADIKRDLVLINDFFVINGLSLDVGKTVVMQF